MARFDFQNLVNWDCDLNDGLRFWGLALPGFDRGPYLIDWARKSHGTLTNGASFGSSVGRQGAFGSVLFDGGNDFVSAAHSASLDITGPLTLSVWFRTASLVGNDGGLISKSSDGTKWFGTTAQKSYELGILDDVAYFQISNGTTNSSASCSTSAHKDNAWHHILATWDGTTAANTIAIYIDGTLQGTGTSAIASIQSLTSTLNFGGYGSLWSYSGHLDGARVYGRGFSADEARRLNVEERTGYPQTLNRLPRRSYGTAGGGGGGNRRRRVIC